MRGCRIFLILIYAFLFAGCCFTRCLPPVEDPHTQDLTFIIQEYAEVMKHKKHVNLTHSHVFYGPTLNSIQMEFITQDILEIPEARELMVDLVEGLLTRLNDQGVGYELISPQDGDIEYIPPAITADQLEIYVNFESYYGRYVDTSYVGWMYLENGICYYYAFDVKDHEKDTWHFRREQYCTSRQIVNAERQAKRLYLEQYEPPRPNPFGKERYIEIEKKRSSRQRWPREIIEPK